MNRKQLMIVVCGLAIALGVPATGAAASRPVGPVDHFHNVFADSGNVCGIDVAETESISGVFTIVGSGVELNAYSVQNTWTNPATGKSVDFHAAVLNTDTIASPTDNGDGTLSFFFKAAGVVQVKSNGALLMHDSGEISTELTLDATTFEFVSLQIVSQGGSSPNLDTCPAIIGALD
jgi:hypothetical protein